MAYCISISKVQTTVLTLASPWKPSPDRQHSNCQLLQIILGGGSLRRVEGARMELSSVQLVRKFAATLLNTMVHKPFNNDKRILAKQRADGVSILTPKMKKV